MSNIHTQFFADSIPEFAPDVLRRLYACIFASIPHWTAAGDLARATGTYVAWKDGEPVALFLFQQDAGTIRVLNEVAYLPAEEIRRFCETAFAHFPSATVIAFHAIRTDSGPASLPCQRYNYSEDIVIDLPPSVDEYRKMLGKATRKNLGQLHTRLRHHCPSFEFRMVPGGELREADLRQIFRFNRLRFGIADKARGADAELERLLVLVKDHGMVGLATIDGAVAGGAICTQLGSHYFSHISAHDARYNEFGLGILCCYLTICACIEQGGEEFHLLWGKYDYKYRLGGVERPLEDLVIYRSWLHYLLRSDMVLRGAYRGRVRRTKLWLHEHESSARLLKLASGFVQGRKHPVP